MVLTVQRPLELLRKVVRTQILGALPIVSDSAGLCGAREPAFLAIPPVKVMMLVPGPYFEGLEKGPWIQPLT